MAQRKAITPALRKVWNTTVEEGKKGYCTGPFSSEEEVTNELGDDGWIPTERFAREQKNKVRGVDSATISEINPASAISEELSLASTDQNVNCIMNWQRRFREKKQELKLKGWVLDEADAYRQIGVSPEHRKYSVIAIKNPDTKKVNYFIMIGHSFGVVAAVYNYNRRSALVNDILRRVFAVPANCFYDDKFGFEPEDTIASAMEAVRKVHTWLGADFSEKKIQLSSKPTILGVEYDLMNNKLEVTEERRAELTAELQRHLSTRKISPGQAAKLKGKLLFAASQLWGKVGRAYLRPLSERQYSKVMRMDVDKALELSMKGWIELLRNAPRRDLKPEEDSGTDAVIFTDGYFPDWRKAEKGEAQVGGVLFMTGGTKAPKYFSEIIPKSTMDKWLTRKNQIAMVELFAPNLAMHLFEEELKDKKVLIFVDSEPVEGALVKGYSSREDMSELVGKFWSQAARIRCNVYIDRVSTDANPADGPSRPMKPEPEPALGWVRTRENWQCEFPDTRNRAWAKQCVKAPKCTLSTSLHSSYRRTRN